MLQSPTKIWAVQLSDDAPIDTAEALVAFYYQKIKVTAPASSSSSSSDLRSKRRPVAQFIMLDHFPALFLCRLDLDTVDLANPDWWGASTIRIQELRDAMAGKPGISPMTAKVLVRSEKLMKVTMGLLLGERFSVEVTEGPNAGRRRFSQEIFKAYTSRIKSQLTVYFADEGIRMIIPPNQWEEFGPRAYFSDA
ncbi:hypothetical protein BJ912DRAFT_956511, partial [Pholiota molesta]